MAERKWGHCKHCKYFSSPANVPLDAEEARCLHPELSQYELTVFGASGCNGFELRKGIPAGVEQPAPGE